MRPFACLAMLAALALAVSCSTTAPPTALAVDTLPMHNVHQVSPKLISGAEPVTEADFAALQKLGVKTIISVDGATPNARRAEAHGIRYIHIPFGYDGVPREQAVKLASVYAQTDTLMYIHCHHGLHRGPAGAMTALVCTGVISPDTAVEEMKTIGTSAHYEGLYRDVRNATVIPAADYVPLASLPSQAPLPGLTKTMAEIDRIWENLKLIQHNGWKPDPSHPDVDPPHEALILKEHFHEIGRQPDIAKRPADFRQHLQDAETAADQLEQAIRASLDSAKLDALRADLGNTCKACHYQYRD